MGTRLRSASRSTIRRGSAGNRPKDITARSEPVGNYPFCSANAGAKLDYSPEKDKDMSADIIAFPSRRDIVMREASSPDKLERAFRESERFIENLYRNLDRVSPEELAARRRALAAAWEAAECFAPVRPGCCTPRRQRFQWLNARARRRPVAGQSR